MNKSSAGFVFSILIFLSAISTASFAKDGWLPITPEDLALKDNPMEPGANAMILYRSITRDDQMGSEEEYVRIKIFKEEGKKYADVILPAFDREGSIHAVSGRTIHPDGTIVKFSGQVFEKVVEKTRDSKLKVKTITMPDVTPGSIIEYRYTYNWEAYDPSSRMYYYFPRSQWRVSGDLFQRTAHFEFIPARADMFSFRVQTINTPADAKIQKNERTRVVTLDMQNIPAFEKEPYMPPILEAETRVLFFYSTDHAIPEGDAYWRDNGKKWFGSVESFIDKRGAVAAAVAHTTSPGDSPEQKAHQLYDLVQSYENLTFERTKMRKEVKALNIREIKSVEDVLNGKYGSRNELNRTFVALARAAGIDATLVKLTERDEALLHREWPSFSQLGYEIASAKINGKTIYLDPGSPFCPFGVLPWEDTGVVGLLFDKNMPQWVQIPLGEPTDSTIKRTAQMALGDDGALSGEIVVTFSGEDAFRHRLRARDEDDTARKEAMEEMLARWLPVKGDVELVEVNDWKSSNLPLVAKYKVTLPGYASQAGHRVLLPATLFASAYTNPFPSTKRVNRIFMEYKYGRQDDVRITLPKSLQVEKLPLAIDQKNVVSDLTVKYESENGDLHFTRDTEMKLVALDPKYYGALRKYFQDIQSETHEQAVLKMAN